MFRMIPLPNESLYDLKQQHEHPMLKFQLRMKLLELDTAIGVEMIEKMTNVLAIEELVLTGDWPKC